MKHFVFFIFLLLLNGNIFAYNNYYFRHISVEDGLQQNTIFCSAQCGNGFLWFATKDGLNRYDGYEFIVFRHNASDKTSIGNNFIRTFSFSPDKETLLVGTDDGAYILDVKTLTFKLFDLKTKNGEKLHEVNSIVFDKDGNVWFASHHLFLWRKHSEQLIEYQTELPAHCLIVDDENTLKIGAPNGLFEYDIHADNIVRAADSETLAQDDIYCLFVDYYNNLVIGTANHGIKKMNLATHKIEMFSEETQLQSLFVRCIMRHSSGDLWFGTESGIYIYKKTADTFVHLTHNFSDPFSLSDNAVYSIFEDREGGVWVGTYFGGINYVPPAYTSFNKYYPAAPSQTEKGERVREFQQDKTGKIWIGTEDNGLYLYESEKQKFTNFMPPDIAYHNIHALLAEGDNLWVGTFTNGLNVVDLKTLKTKKFYRHELVKSVFAICKDHNGDLWFGTLEGLCRYNAAADSFTKIDFLGNNFVYDILETSDGHLWIATFSNGLFSYNLRTQQWEHFRHNAADPASIAHNKIISLFEDSRKTLWLSTEGNGVSRYNADKQNFTNFNTANGLPNDIVYKIIEDKNGCLWLSTNNGLCQFNIENQTFVTYLNGNTFNYKSGFRAADGTLYFGTISGFVSFDPAIFTQNAYRPPVEITHIYVNNKELSLKKQITLNYRQSNVIINFAALSYIAPEKNTYSWKLENFDDEWNTAQGKTVVTYSNLLPKKYIFRVKASNNDGVWNDNETTLVINILPPFYNSIWAYIIYVLLLGILTFLVFRFRRFWKKIREKLKRKKQSSIVDNRRLYEMLQPESTTDLQFSPADEEFLNKVIDVIHKNLSDSAFSVDALANRVYVSRSSLHRRIKKITGFTPNDFMLMIRLEKSLEYLKAGKHNITEISTIVGFETPSYFSKSFKKRYGKSPINYMKETGI